MSFKCQWVSSLLDFLANHGGKVAIVALSIAVGLIYTYYKSGEDRSNVEKEVSRSVSIEPYEIQELRYSNELTLAQYQNIVGYFRHHYPSDSVIRYDEFVQQISRNSSFKLRNGYLFDRMVVHYATTNGLLHASTEKVDVKAVKLPIMFLLVALSLALQEPPIDRIRGLFQIIAQNIREKSISNFEIGIAALEDNSEDELIPTASLGSIDLPFDMK